jgi:cytochrome c556
MRKLAQLVLLVGGLGLCLGNLVAEDKEKKVPSVHDIMEEGHSGKKSLIKQITNAVKDSKWDDAAKPSERFKFFGESIGKNKPETGSEESWKKLTEAYKKTTAEIAEGVKKKDKAAVDKALKTMAGSCKACHDAHQK